MTYFEQMTQRKHLGQAWNQVRDRVSDKVQHQVWDQVRDRVSDKVQHQVWDQLENDHLP